MEDVARTRSLRSWLMVSLAVAAGAFASGPILFHVPRLRSAPLPFFDIVFALLLALRVIRLLIVAVAARILRRPALWLLLGVPLALPWFLIAVAIERASLACVAHPSPRGCSL